MLHLDENGAFRDTCFAKQMYGPATERMLGHGDVIDSDIARIALRTMFRHCFSDGGQGRGAVA